MGEVVLQLCMRYAGMEASTENSFFSMGTICMESVQVVFGWKMIHRGLHIRPVPGSKNGNTQKMGGFAMNCVPEPPEVTEIMDGSCLIRIIPMPEKERELTKLCVQEIGYQGNNLLCSNWNLDSLDTLDYNGLYEYLYRMKYGECFPSEKYQEGIPKEEFESLIMDYLPVSAENLQQYAEFDEKAKICVGIFRMRQLCSELFWNFCAGGGGSKRKS